MYKNHAESKLRLERFETTAREAGIKLTHQRLVIFQEIAASDEHPDVEAVYQAVRKQLPTISLDTVYRTLWTLNDLGLITTLSPRRENIRFDPNLKQHHHFVCTNCGSIRDFESESFNSLAVPMEVQKFGTVVSTSVELRGLCEKCSHKRQHSVNKNKEK
ncbi:MAG: transcriptional repressor [bacterium]|nr:transcriptional repressor [bacterium]